MFKAKSINTGEWVCGYYAKMNDNHVIITYSRVK